MLMRAIDLGRGIMNHRPGRVYCVFAQRARIMTSEATLPLGHIRQLQMPRCQLLRTDRCHGKAQG
jgi:hypothetical protein